MSRWSRFQNTLLRDARTGFTLDVSRMDFDEAWLEGMADATSEAAETMRELEGGAIANPDENRRVGHYWLRSPALAPEPALRAGITRVVAACREFATAVHAGRCRPPGAARFRHLLVVGIGGSALGPQLVADALGHEHQQLELHFLDNSDPDGFDRVFAGLAGDLDRTLTFVVSKSGGTPETRNGMLEARAAYERAGLDFGKHAVAITGPGSALDRTADAEGWIARFPMEDWVGGRTSVMSAVGLLPAALQGVDIERMLDGAAAMDEHTRSAPARENMGMMLALMWHRAGDGRGGKDMVILPYKDRLALFSRYLQQLVMESLGKELDTAGRVVHQGIAVYGNKGSTDQHAYVQQLRDGVNNFFVTFIEVRRGRESASRDRDLEVGDGTTSADYLQGFLRGTREALTGNDRQSLTISLPRLDAGTLGALIALFERAVGFYASFVGINAYHQPGVQAGKEAADHYLALLARVRAALAAEPAARTADEVASAIDAEPESVYHCLVHLAANEPLVEQVEGAHPGRDTFRHHQS